MDVEFASEEANALGNACESLAIGADGSGKSATVVENGEADEAVLALELKDGLGGVGVFEDVVDGFLGDAIDGDFNFGGERIKGVEFEFAGQAGGGGGVGLLDDPLDGFGEAELVEFGGAQGVGNGADFMDGLGGGGGDFLELVCGLG